MGSDAVRDRPMRSASSSLDGSVRKVPSGKTMVGMIRLPPLRDSTSATWSGWVSRSIHVKGIRCEIKNCFARRQSGHQLAP